MKQAKPVVATRSRDAALGRETRSLVGPAKAARSTSSARSLPAFPSLGGRRGGAVAGLRRRGIRRLVTPARAAGLLGMLASGFLLTFVTGPSAFGVTRTDVPALEWTADADVRAVLAIPDGSNAFEVETSPLEAALESLPAVADAEVVVTLPDAAVVVTIEERVAILAWDVVDQRFLADREGVIFAAVDRDAELPAAVAIVEDRRTVTAPDLAVGARLDPVDLDVATRLGSVTPTDVGSAASRLRVRITNADGFSLYAEKGWTAVFGFYSPATRPTGMIPGQVRLLRSLIGQASEGTITRMVLASETDGTYVPKRTPRPART